jgi:GH24 family phage-related lysozyme (muramidase)
MKNFATRVKQIGGRGWHVTAFANGKLGKGCPMSKTGSAHNSWNDELLACEMCMDGDSSKDVNSPAGQTVIQTAAWWAAQILKQLKLPVNKQTVRFHRDEPSAKKRGKTCPGKLVNHDEFLKLVEKFMATADAAKVAPVIAEKPLEDGKRINLWVNTPGDTLNFRDGPAGRIKSVLPHGLPVWVIGGGNGWAEVSTPAGYQGWVSASYLSPTDPNKVPEKKEPAEEPKPTEVLFQPGQYKYSQFCVDWAKRFEGLRLTAYWDVSGWAIGYGHNGGSGIPPYVDKDSVITEAEAERILLQDLDLQLHYVEAYVDVPLTQGQIDALCLHVFQQGPGNFRNGKVRPLVNAGKHAEAAATIKNWPTSKAGLVRRRAVEAQIYLGEKPTKW